MEIVKKIAQIPYDKLLHNLAGLLIYLAVTNICIFVHNGIVVLSLSMIAVVIAAILREVYNKKHGGKFDGWDIAWTIFGGLEAMILTINLVL